MPPANPDSASLAAHLARFRDSDRAALQTDAVTISYAGLFSLVQSAAAQLRETGLRAGDRALLTMPNGAAHVIAVLAADTIGAVAVPLDPDAGGARLHDVVQQTAPRCCVLCDESRAPAGIPAVRLRVDASAPAVRCTREGPAVGPQSLPASPESIAFIRFTSGSTGHPKGVVLTREQQLWIARTLSGQYGLDAAHRELVLVSLALSGGWQRVAATLHSGGCVIIGDRPLSVGDLLEQVVRERATGFFTPPPLIRMLLAGPEEEVRDALRDCRSIEIGSAAILPEELREFIARVPNARVFVHYGLTECSRAVVLEASRDPDRLDTVGTPLPGVELRIVRDSGRDAAIGESGQIHLRGPQLTGGYWGQPELDRQRFTDGWLATGDYGRVDEAGYLTLLGRHDDLINCGGHCYFPNEVEQVLGTPDGIAQYLVAGVPDPRGVLQQVPWTFVVPLDAETWQPAGFLAAARSRLPSHMVPRRVVVVPRLPQTPSGKPDRRKTVQLYATNE